MGILIVVIPFVACFLLGMCLDRKPRWTWGRPTGNADPAAQAAPDVPAEPTTDTRPAKGRAKPAGQEERASRPASAAHPTAVALSLQWTALDQLQLERLLRTAAPRSG
jgi:hypothetical protein